MRDIVLELIQFEPENSLLDFKREQYPIGKAPKRNELIKDIIAMANHLSDEDKYIVVGVKELNGTKKFFSIETLVDDASYQSLIKENVEPQIFFEYKSLDYEGATLAYFRLFKNIDRPYLVKKDVADYESKVELKRGDGFIRRGTSTVRLGRNDFDMIYKSKTDGRDRRNDLRITHEFSTHYHSDRVRPQFLNITVENHSNSSISFDAELIIFKNDRLRVLSEAEIEKENSDVTPFHTVVPSMWVDISELYDAYIIRTTSKGGIHISQDDVEKDIFSKHTILRFKQSQNFQAQLKLRSDEFKQGPLIYHIDTTIEK